MLIGTILLTVGYFGAALSKNLISLYFSAGLGIGVGSSFLTVASVAVVPAYFSAKDTNNNGVDMSKYMGRAMSNYNLCELFINTYNRYCYSWFWIRCFSITIFL